jgi:hypothetical protein
MVYGIKVILRKPITFYIPFMSFSPNALRFSGFSGKMHFPLKITKVSWLRIVPLNSSDIQRIHSGYLPNNYLKLSFQFNCSPEVALHLRKQSQKSTNNQANKKIRLIPSGTLAKHSKSFLKGPNLFLNNFLQ